MLPQVGNFSSGVDLGLLFDNWKVKTTINIKFKTIKKIGKDLACILSPTIISGEVSSCNATAITITEKTANNNGTIYIFFVIMILKKNALLLIVKESIYLNIFISLSPFLSKQAQTHQP